jgi:uncharacterized membrane protein
MPISKIIITYLLSFVVFLGIDLVWLGFIAKSFYKKYLGAFLTPHPNWTAAIIFYILFVVGILIFSVFPGLAKDSLKHTMIYGALFGFFTYTTYDLTNLATLKNWPIQIAIVDMLWGTLLALTVSTAGFYIAKWLM